MRRLSSHWNIGAHLDMDHRWAPRFNDDIKFVVLIAPWARLCRARRPPLRGRFLATLGARIFARRPLGSHTLFVKGDRAPIKLTHRTETLLRPLSPAWLPRIDDSV
jgi:hypothetical protein